MSNHKMRASVQAKRDAETSAYNARVSASNKESGYIPSGADYSLKAKGIADSVSRRANKPAPIPESSPNQTTKKANTGFGKTFKNRTDTIDRLSGFGD